MHSSKYSIIVAVDEQGGIARNGNIPWHVPEDLEFFRSITTKHKENVVIMGRVTYEAIPKSYRPLPGRINIVLSHQKYCLIEAEENEVRVYSSLAEALFHLGDTNKEREIFICGGAELYREALSEPYVKLCDRVYVSHIRGSYECDRFFPLAELEKWPIQRKEDYGEFLFCVYERNQEELQYLALLRELKEKSKNAIIRPDRTGVGTYSEFVRTLTYDISTHIPLLTTKFVKFEHVVGELLWFLKANPSIVELQKQDIHIWDSNTTRDFLDNNGLKELPENEIGLLYGLQLRAFNTEYLGATSHIGHGVDQLTRLIEQLKKDPYSRRHIVSYYNPSVRLQCLYPCHIFFQMYVEDLPNGKRGLSTMLLMRSTDCMLGLPYNQVFYSVLTYMIAHLCDMLPYRLKIVMNDCHLYSNHLDAVETQLKREPYAFPTLELIHLEHIKSIDDFTLENFRIHDYQHHPRIKAPMAI